MALRGHPFLARNVPKIDEGVATESHPYKIKTIMIFSSPQPAVPIPDIPRRSLCCNARRPLMGKPAIIDGPSGRTLSYVQLTEAISRVAAGLASYGMRKGDVLAI